MAHDEIDGRLRVVGREWKMSFPFPDDDCDLSAEFLVSLLDHASLAVQPWVEAAAIVKDWDARLGQRSQVVDGSRLRHETVQRGIARINTRDLICNCSGPWFLGRSTIL